MAFPPSTDRDPRGVAMKRVYVRVVALEVAIIVALWLFGRMFS